VIWGTIGPAVRLVDDGSQLFPLAINAYRAVIAVVVLLGLTAAFGRLRVWLTISRRHPGRVLTIGLATAAFQALFFLAVVWVGVSVATVVCLGVAPVLLLVVDAVRRRRRPAVGRAVTVGLAVVGLVLVGADGGVVGTGPYAALGVGAALASGVAFALSAEVAAPLSQRYDGLSIATATMCVAAAVLVPVGLGVGWLRGEVLVTADPGSWLLIGYLGAVTMALAYVLLFVGLRSTPAGAAVVATLLEPVTAVVIAVAFLGEHLTPAGAVGVLLIMLAIGGAGRPGRSEPVQEGPDGGRERRRVVDVGRVPGAVDDHLAPVADLAGHVLGGPEEGRVPRADHAEHRDGDGRE
jgi:DME family drug/metabolite transporter